MTNIYFLVNNSNHFNDFISHLNPSLVTRRVHLLHTFKDSSLVSKCNNLDIDCTYLPSYRTTERPLWLTKFFNLCNSFIRIFYLKLNPNDVLVVFSEKEFVSILASIHFLKSNCKVHLVEDNNLATYLDSFDTAFSFGRRPLLTVKLESFMLRKLCGEKYIAVIIICSA